MNRISKWNSIRIWLFLMMNVIGSLLLAQSDSSTSANSPSQSAASTTTSATEKSTKKKVQVLNFEDELIEGSNQKPELFYLFQRKNFNYKRLIKLRENFIPEMRKTSEDIQHNRSGN